MPREAGSRLGEKIDLANVVRRFGDDPAAFNDDGIDYGDVRR
jgi:hypothetical protein